MPTTQNGYRNRTNRMTRMSRPKPNSRPARARAPMAQLPKLQVAKTDGQYGLDDLTYDSVTILHNKSKGLEAYRRYITDARTNLDIRAMLERFRNDDLEKVDELRACLAGVLGEDSHT